MYSWNLFGLQILSGIYCIQSSKSASVGGQQVLDCILQFPLLTYVLEWKKADFKDPVLIQHCGFPPNIHEEYADRVRLVNGISLEISHILEPDEGWYECRVMYLDGIENENSKRNGTWIYLDVNIPPRIISSSPQSFHQPRGSSVKIYCRGEGSPSPRVSWMKDGKPLQISSRVQLQNGDSKVIISNLADADGGIYKCTFQNTVGLIAQTVHLIVEGQAYIIGPPSNKTAVLGQRITFSCDARGYPNNITYRWYKDNKNVNTLPGYGSRIVINDYDGSLVIITVEKTDMAWFLCRPSNGLGDDPEAMAFLNITYKPEVLVDLMPSRVIWALGFKEKLNCPVDANPPASQILWTKNGIVINTYDNRLLLLDNGTLVVNQVMFSDAGNYRCTAISSFSTGDSKIVQVEVKDPPRFTTLPDAQYILQLGEMVTIPCVAIGTPQPMITWRKADGSSLAFDSRIQQNGGNLTFQNLQKSDNGVYECEARNEVRKIITITELVIQNTTPYAPYNVSVDTQLFTATIRWIPAYSNTLQHFVVWYRSVVNSIPSKWQTMSVEPQNTTRFTLYNLEPDTLYEFQVRVRNEFGEGQSSVTVQARTSGYEDGIADVLPTDADGHTYLPPIVRPIGPRPSPPVNVTASLTDHGIIVSWSPLLTSPVKIFQYIVEYSTGSTWEKTAPVLAPETSFIFTQLDGGQTYSFRVFSYGLLAISTPSGVAVIEVPKDKSFGLSNAEIGGIIGGLLFLVIAITLAVIALVCSRYHGRQKQDSNKYGNVKYNGPQDNTDGRSEYTSEWIGTPLYGRRANSLSPHGGTVIGKDNGIFMVQKSGDVFSGYNSVRSYSKFNEKDTLLHKSDTSKNVPHTTDNFIHQDSTSHFNRDEILNQSYSHKPVPYDDRHSVRLRNRFSRSRSRSQPGTHHSDGPNYPVPERPRSQGQSLMYNSQQDIDDTLQKYGPGPQVTHLQSPFSPTHTLTSLRKAPNHTLPYYHSNSNDDDVFLQPATSFVVPPRPAFPRHSSLKPGAQQTYLTDDLDGSDLPFITNELSSVLPSPFSDSQNRTPDHLYRWQYSDGTSQNMPYENYSPYHNISQSYSYNDINNTVVASQPLSERSISRTIVADDGSDSSGRPTTYTRDQIPGKVDQVFKGPRAPRINQSNSGGFGVDSIISKRDFQIAESVKPGIIVRDRPSRGYLNEEYSRSSESSVFNGTHSGRENGSVGVRSLKQEKLISDSFSSGIGSRNTSSQLTGSSLNSHPSRLGSNLTPKNYNVSQDSTTTGLDYTFPHRKDISADENYEFDSYNAVESDLLEALRNYSEIRNGDDELFSALQTGLSTNEMVSELYPKPSRQSKYSDSEQRFEKLRGEFQKYRQQQQQQRQEPSQGFGLGFVPDGRYNNSYSSTQSSHHSGNYGDNRRQYYGGLRDDYKAGPMDSDML